MAAALINNAISDATLTCTSATTLPLQNHQHQRRAASGSCILFTIGRSNICAAVRSVLGSAVFLQRQRQHCAHAQQQVKLQRRRRAVYASEAISNDSGAQLASAEQSSASANTGRSSFSFNQTAPDTLRASGTAIFNDGLASATGERLVPVRQLSASTAYGSRL